MHFGLLKRPQLPDSPAMPAFESSTVVILLSSILGSLVLLLGIAHGISRSLLRIEKRLTDPGSRTEPAESPASLAENPHGGAFESFLSEDPERRKLTKAEQFAQYRRWRQEKGMNWTNS